MYGYDHTPSGERSFHDSYKLSCFLKILVIPCLVSSTTPLFMTTIAKLPCLCVASCSPLPGDEKIKLYYLSGLNTNATSLDPVMLSAS